LFFATWKYKYKRQDNGEYYTASQLDYIFSNPESWEYKKVEVDFDKYIIWLV
jgi:hypothetical protein